MMEKKKEDLKRKIEEKGLVCDCGERVFVVGAGAVENQPNYNKYFEHLECPKCRKLFYL
jgi:uncharacterized protein with PIN domain